MIAWLLLSRAEFLLPPSFFFFFYFFFVPSTSSICPLFFFHIFFSLGFSWDSPAVMYLIFSLYLSSLAFKIFRVLSLSLFAFVLTKSSLSYTEKRWTWTFFNNLLFYLLTAHVTLIFKYFFFLSKICASSLSLSVFRETLNNYDFILEKTDLNQDFANLLFLVEYDI